MSHLILNMTFQKVSNIKKVINWGRFMVLKLLPYLPVAFSLAVQQRLPWQSMPIKSEPLGYRKTRFNSKDSWIQPQDEIHTAPTVRLNIWFNKYTTRESMKWRTKHLCVICRCYASLETRYKQRFVNQTSKNKVKNNTFRERKTNIRQSNIKTLLSHTQTYTTDFQCCNPQLLLSLKLPWVAWLAAGGVVIHQKRARAPPLENHLQETALHWH